GFQRQQRDGAGPGAAADDSDVSHVGAERPLPDAIKPVVRTILSWAIGGTKPLEDRVVRGEWLPGCCVPQPQPGRESKTRDESAAGTEGQGVNGASVSLERDELRPVVGIPDPGRPVGAAARDSGPIRTERNHLDDVLVPPEHERC